MMPSLVGSKRLREDYEDDIAQIRDAVLQALSRHENPDAGLKESVAEFSKHTQDVLSQNPTELVYYLRVTLQHIISAAHKGQEPLLTYRLKNESQPAVQTLLKVVAGEVFSLILDVVETNRAEDVKACLVFMDTLWDSWNTLPASFATSSKTQLAFQKVYNMFCQRVSNNQDAEVLGAVATVVAKLMPFNAPAGLNIAWNCHQHDIPVDESIGASVDGSDPIDLPFYRQLWELQLLFQRPHDQTEPEQWAKTISGIQLVLDTLKAAPIGVASRTTAVPQGMRCADGGTSVIVKYLTSSKLTRLQLRDAAFRRTLLLQCLVLLHACAHPIPRKSDPGRRLPKQPVPVLKEKQMAELKDVENQLYDELSKTPKQGEAFAEVIKTVLDRETAFVKWKLEGATAFWDKEAAAPKMASLDRPLPRVPARKVPEEPDYTAPDTALDLSKMWDNSGTQEDLYRLKRDARMLPTMEQHLAQVGREISGNVPLQKKQYAHTKAPGGVDPLFLFRAQRMLQRKDIELWTQTTQLDMPGERLEVAFDTLYPGRVGPNWIRPVLPKPKSDDRQQQQHDPKKVGGKVTPGRAVSGAMEDELAGVKPSADVSMTQAQPVGEDTLQVAVDPEAGVGDTKPGKEVDGPSVHRKSMPEVPDVTKPESAANQGTTEASDVASSVALPGDEPANLYLATADDDLNVPSSTDAPAGSAGKLIAQANTVPEAGTVKQRSSVPAITGEAATEQSLQAGVRSEAVTEAAKSAAGNEAVNSETAAEIKSEHDASSKDAVEADSHTQEDAVVPMDEVLMDEDTT